MRRSCLLIVLVMVLVASCDLLDPINDTIDDIKNIDKFDPSVYDNVEPDSVLTLATDQNTIPADGVSTVEITATITKTNADDDKRTVTFTTSAGTLLGAEGGTLTVTAGEDRKAVAILQSSQRVETARVQASLAGVVRQTTVDFKTVGSADMLTLELSDLTVRADGVSKATLTATLGPSVSSANRTVTFTTTIGTFESTSNSSIEVPAVFSDEKQTFIAKTELRSVRAGMAVTTARLDHFEASALLTWNRVQPEEIRIIVDAGGFALKADPTFAHSTQVTATLNAEGGGVASIGTPVLFTALDTMNQVLPGFDHPTDGFRAVKPTNDQGEATALFSVGGTPYRGLIKLIATLPADTTISGMDGIQIIDP